MLNQPPWMQPPTPRQSFGFGVKPQTQRFAHKHLPQGCSAKRRIISNEATVVNNFLLEARYLSLPCQLETSTLFLRESEWFHRSPGFDLHELFAPISRVFRILE